MADVSASLLPLIPGLPLLGAVVNALVQDRVSRPVTGAIATLAVAIPAVLAFLVLGEVMHLSHGEDPAQLATTLYTWASIGAVHVDMGLLVDPLSALFVCVITGVGTLIHLYSVGYMDEEKDAASVWRFFSYLNLFVFAMLLLVMGDSFPLMFVGWEGVGLCSYLLIGFWYEDHENAGAGKKAFIVNRVGDFCFLVGLFWLFWTLGEHATLNFAELRAVLEAHPGLVGGVGGFVATGVCLLFFGGATGKSAQIPLYVWLPDAMAGPTPVSALIHAATMVTAGIYMLCRLSFLFVLAPFALSVVAAVGAVTALLAATIAVTQNDIKKVLAYSTVSQLGYMFLGVGVGAFTAGFFHVVTHAFFKALLFLGSGSIIHALHHEQDMRHMGGLRKAMPITFGTFLVGYLAIIGFPGFSGFFSKDEILWLALNAGGSFGIALWAVGFVTALLTAFYMTRLMVMTFGGTFRGHHAAHESPWVVTVPLVVLAVLALVGGGLNLPHWIADHGFMHHFLASVLPAGESAQPVDPVAPEFGVMGVTLLGIAASVFAAFKIYGGDQVDPLAEKGGWLWEGSSGTWYVDELYELVVVKPIHLVSKHVLHPVVDALCIDGTVNGVAKGFVSLGRLYGRGLQTGSLPVYATSIALAASVLVFIAAWGG